MLRERQRCSGSARRRRRFDEREGRLMLRVLFSRAELYGVAKEIGKQGARRSVWIVIDVLRATTSMVAAFEAGCAAIRPAVGIAEARRLRKGSRAGKRILAGERDGKPIRGFDLGNSPRELIPERVAGRDIVLTTSNGTRTIRAITDAGAGEVWVASFANAAAVSRRAADLIKERRNGCVNLVCSGRDARFCLEDAVCAGLIIGELRGKGVELTDSALACWNLYDRHRVDLLGMLRESSWGKRLQEIGLGADLDFCARTGWSRIVPVYARGVIRQGK